jgi:hypothetical protein
MGLRYTRELLKQAVRESRTFDEAVQWFGVTATPGRRRYLRELTKAAGIDTSHFTNGRIHHDEQRLREIAAQSRSVVEVVRRLGISPVGGNQTHIARRIAVLGIDISHFGKDPARPKRAAESVLTLGSRERGRVPGDRLRRALLRRGVAEECAECGTGPVRNGRPLRLEVDHVNGDWWDNRPENLRLLCPNCHSVTDTFRGRRRRRAA